MCRGARGPGDAGPGGAGLTRSAGPSRPGGTPSVRVVLVSTYDLGRQPFGLASPAAWLREAGAEVVCQDLAVEDLDPTAIRAADLIAFHLPMHTATRLATRLAPRVREINPRARLCFYGLYAAMNERLLRRLGADFVLGGEFESGLASVVGRLAATRAGVGLPQVEPVVSLERQAFRPPDRRGLPALARYARLRLPGGRTKIVGYTEASRGCKHRCRHCPIVPVYGGRFRVVARDVVLEDVRRQVAAGARHVTFGDPDFFNGIGHAIPLVRDLHAEHPRLTYDATIKIEHLLRHREHLRTLRETGCLFVTSAVESIDDRVLALLDKGHTRADFLEAVRLCREAGLVLQPTFVAFHPWTTAAGYRELLDVVEGLGLPDQVAPVQLAIRLLIPAGSRLLELPEVRAVAGRFDERALVHPWAHPDPEVDRLQRRIELLVREAAARGESRRRIFGRVRRLAGARRPAGEGRGANRRAPVPYLTEPWYC